MEIKTNKTIHRLTLLTLCAIAALQPRLASAMNTKNSAIVAVIMEKRTAAEQTRLNFKLFEVLQDKNLDAEARLEAVEKVLKNGANVNLKNNSKWRPLHFATFYGYTDVVKLLIKNSAKINAVDYENKTPLHFAAGKGYTDVVKLLIKNGAKINAVDNENNTPLHFAADKGYTGVVKLLIKNGAKINAVDNKNKTSLHLAAFGGHLDVVKFLIENGANVNAVNKENKTPLQLAARYGNRETVTYLALVEDLLTTIENPDTFNVFAEKYLDLNDTKQVKQNLTDIIGILAPRIASIGKEFRKKLFNWMQKNNKLLLERNKDQDNELEEKWFFLDLVYQAAVTATHTKHALLNKCFTYLQKTDTAFSEAVNACISLNGVWEKKQNTYTKEQHKERQKGRDALKKEKDKRVEQNNLLASTAYPKKLFIPKKLPQVPVLKNENATVNKNATVTKGDEKFTDSDFWFEKDN